MAKYNVKYNGTMYSSKKMSHIAALIGQASGELPSEVYQKLVGRKMPLRAYDNFVEDIDSQIRTQRLKAEPGYVPAWRDGGE